MLTKSPPFRGAHMKDPYFRRLTAQDKKAFWKIFAALNLSDLAKDLFEKLVEREPSKRFNICDIKQHPWFSGE